MAKDYKSTNLNNYLQDKDSILVSFRNQFVSAYQYDSLYDKASVTTYQLAQNSITTNNLGTAIIDTDQIVDSAVTGGKIASDAVTTSKIIGSAVTTTKIADGAVTALKLSNDSVGSANIIDGNVTTNELAGSAVTNAKINDFAWTKGTSGTATFGGTTNTYGRIEVKNSSDNVTHSFGSAGFLVSGTAVTIDNNTGTTRVQYGGLVAKTAILETSEGYKAVYCMESPEVWFMDFVGEDKVLDPLFAEVTVEPYHYIKCEGGGYQVWGKRKYFGDTRFTDKTEEQFDQNARFWLTPHIA